MTTFVPNLFENRTITDERTIALESDISEHVAWAQEHIYSKPQAKGTPLRDINRPFHGIQHVSRAASYIPIFANLYRKARDKAALQLDDRMIKLLQIAAVFHDCGREDEGEDLWDCDSALNLYYYLTLTLNVEQSEAKVIAEACANKDIHNGQYFSLNIDGVGHPSWIGQASEAGYKKDIYQKLIHDADCLDIIRARAKFDPSYLDCYQDFEGNASILDPLRLIIIEAHGLIERQGDAYRKQDYDKKIAYEHSPECYQRITGDFADFPTLSDYFNEGEVVEKESLSQLDIGLYTEEEGNSEANLRRALLEGRVFSRGIYVPSMYHINRAYSATKHRESAAQLELRKIFRRTETRTLSGKYDKHGNPYRSVAAIGWGMPTFSPAGLLIINPDHANITEINTVDVNSGRGKKKHYADRETKSPEAIGEDFYNLLSVMKTGGDSVSFEGVESLHNEIIFTIDKVDAIYFNRGAVLTEKFKSNIRNYQSSPELQAIYLQQMHQHMSGEDALPIYEYSSNNTNLKAHEYDDEAIFQLWIDLFREYLESNQKNKASTIAQLNTHSLDKIKNYLLYGVLERDCPSADVLYSEDLKRKIDEHINSMIEEYRASYIEEITAFIESSKIYDLEAISEDFFQWDAEQNSSINIEYVLSRYAHLDCFLLIDKPEYDAFFHALLDNLFDKITKTKNELIREINLNKFMKIAQQIESCDLPIKDLLLFRMNCFIEANFEDLSKGIVNRFIESPVYRRENFDDCMLNVCEVLGKDELKERHINALAEGFEQKIESAPSVWNKQYDLTAIANNLRNSKKTYVGEIKASFKTKVETHLESVIEDKECKLLDVYLLTDVYDIDTKYMKQAVEFFIDREDRTNIQFSDELLLMLNNLERDLLTDEFYAKIIENLSYFRTVYYVGHINQIAKRIDIILKQRNEATGCNDLPEVIQEAIASKLKTHGPICKAAQNARGEWDRHNIPLVQLRDELQVYTTLFPTIEPPKALMDYFLLAIKHMQTLNLKSRFIYDCVKLYNELSQRTAPGATQLEASQAIVNFEDAILDAVHLGQYSIEPKCYEDESKRNIVPVFQKSNFKKASLKKATLDKLDFTGSSFEGASLDGASLKGANFEGVNLSGASFIGCPIDDKTNFNDCLHLDKAKFITREFNSTEQLLEKLSDWQEMLKNHPQQQQLKIAIAHDICQLIDESYDFIDRLPIIERIMRHDWFMQPESHIVHKSSFFSCLTPSTNASGGMDEREVLVSKKKELIGQIKGDNIEHLVANNTHHVCPKSAFFGDAQSLP